MSLKKRKARYLTKSQTKKIKGLCRYCRGTLPKRRRSFCSNECVHEYRLRTSSSYLRSCVFKRDFGICSKCKVDTHWLKKYGRFLLKNFGTTEYFEYAKLLNFDPHRKTWWDAHHIVPVSQDGGACGLDNIATLCIDCHKQITKEQIIKKKNAK